MRNRFSRTSAPKCFRTQTSRTSASGLPTAGSKTRKVERHGTRQKGCYHPRQAQEYPGSGEGLLWPPQEHHPHRAARSEEHTSELQSLMRISYAVFCLKKKKTKTNHNSNIKKHIQVHRNHKRIHRHRN